MCSATKVVSAVSRQTHSSFDLASASDERCKGAELQISAQFSDRHLCALYMQPSAKVHTSLSSLHINFILPSLP